MPPLILKTADIVKRNPDTEAVRRILIDEHDFSPERIKRTLEKLAGAHERKKQSSLGSFI